MDFETQLNELTRIWKEYRQFFPQCELLQIINEDKNSVHGTRVQNDRTFDEHPKELKPESNCILIQIPEGRKVTISVNTAGWHLMNPEEDLNHGDFETFEALMMSISQKFSVMFNEEVSRKLQYYLEDPEYFK